MEGGVGEGVGGLIRHREGLNQMTALRFKMEGGVGGWGWGVYQT